MLAKKSMRHWAWVGMIAVVATASSGCASSGAVKEKHDPYEGFNRAVFKFNDKLDSAVLKPTAKGYQYVTPQFMQTGVRNFFSNLSDINVTINQFLQMKFKSGTSDAGRFVTNSTLGVGGLFDVASKFGMRKHDEDFGQTLGYWGVGTGPYLVLPFFGPSNFRDGPARIADALTNPLFYLNEPAITWPLFTLDIVSTRADLLSAEEIVNDLGYDRYKTIRNAYLDHREFLVKDGNPTNDELFEDLDDEGAGATQSKPAADAKPGATPAPAAQ